MPRKPIEQDPRYVELRTYVEQVESSTLPKIADLKIQLRDAERKMRWQKSEAIMHAVKSGLSVYGAAKAAGIKSSAKRATLIADAQKAISEYYGGNE